MIRFRQKGVEIGLTVWMGMPETYYLDAMTRGGGQSPGAGLLAGVFVWPVRAGDCT